MKIIHCGHVPVPEGHPQRQYMGAVHPGRWVLNHAIAQKNAGMDVEVVTQAHKAKCDFICEIEGVKVHFLRTYHPYRHFTFYAIDQFRMASYVRNLHPDIVHAHGTEAAYAMAAIRTGLPFCITAQGLFFQIIPALGHKPDLNMRFQRISENWAWKRTHYAIAKSEYGRKALFGRYPQLDVSLIYNTYSSVFDQPLLAKRGRQIAFVGSVDYRKGLHILAGAICSIADSFPDMVLHIMGNPPESELTGYGQEHISSLRNAIGDRLVIHGKLPQSDLCRILDQCSIIAAPSLEEMSGNQVTEGLLRGCHAVLFCGTGAGGIAGHCGNSTLVSPGNAAEFAEALKAELLAPSPDEKRKRAIENVRALMSSPVVAEKHRLLYERILSERKNHV